MSRLKEEADQFLQLIAEEAEELGIDLPEKQVTTTGLIAYDCEMVAAQINGVQTGVVGSPQPIQENCPPMWFSLIFVDIVRCGPKILRDGSVTAEAMNDNTEIQSTDAEILMGAVRRRMNVFFGAVGAEIAFPTREGDFMATRLVLSIPVR